MKKKMMAILVALIGVSMLVSSVLASGSPPGGGWWSGEQVQNVSDAEAQMVVEAYDPATGGPTYLTAEFTVPSGGAKTFLPADFVDMPTGFSGSAVVSASGDIRAVVNLTNRLSGAYGITGGLAAGQYQGTNSGSSSLKFPLAKNDFYGKVTTYYIQNAGAEATTVTATFYVGANSFDYTSPSVEPGRMVAISPADAGMSSGNTVGIGSLVITSSPEVPLAGVVLEHKLVENPATLLQATRGFSPTEASSTIYAPAVKNNFFGRFTGLQVQNADVVPVDITVTYSSATAACDGEQDVALNVQPNSSATFVHLGASTNLNSGCLASAMVEATGDVLGIVNESYTAAFLTANPGRAQESTTYSTFSAALATTKISLPVYKENSYYKGTGIVVQNVTGTDATNVVITFVGSTGTYVTAPLTIAAGSGLALSDVRNKPASFWNGTAMTPTVLGGCSPNCGASGLFGVTVTADQAVVAIANESTYPFTTPAISQDKNNYEGFNLVP